MRSPSTRRSLSIVPDQERQLHTDAGPQWSGRRGAVERRRRARPPAGRQGRGHRHRHDRHRHQPGQPLLRRPRRRRLRPHQPARRRATTSASATRRTRPPQEFDPNFPCNDKLIGAYVFGGANPNGNSALDYDGHGSHTASTSGGNVVDDVIVDGADDHDAAVRHLRRRPARQRHLLPRLLHALRPDRGDRPGDRRRGRRHQLLDRLGRRRRRCGTTSTPSASSTPAPPGIFVATSNGNDRPGLRHDRLTRRRPVAHVGRRRRPTTATTATPSPA